MKRIINYFVENTFVVNLITLLILGFGAVSLWHLPKRIIDKVDQTSIEVRATLRGASALQIERNLTTPLEAALKDLDQLVNISSVSWANGVSLELSFEDGADSQARLQEVKQRIDAIRSDLPLDTEYLQASIANHDGGDLLASLAVLEYNSLDPKHYSWYQKFKRKMLAIPGVVRVEEEMQKPRIEVAFRPEKLEQFALSVPYLRQKILVGLRFAPVGMIKNQDHRYLMEIESNFDDLDAIKKIPIKAMTDGPIIVLDDVATVKFAPPPNYTRDFIDGDIFGQIWIKTSNSADLTKATKQLDDLLNAENKVIPPPLKIKTIIKGVTFIDRQLEILNTNAGYGLLLLFVSLILFVGGRISLMVALGIPVAYLGTFIVMDACSISINLVSFIAIIIILGVLVDDAIVVSEKYRQNLELGTPPKDAAKKAAHDMFLPVTGGIITTMVAFIPVLMLPGSFGAILLSIPIIVFSAFLLSWFESFFILPNHLAHAVRSKPKYQGKFYEKVKSLYEKYLWVALRWRYVLLGALAAGLLIVAILVLPKLKADNWSVNVNDAKVSVSGELMTTNSLEDSEQQLQGLIKELKSAVPNESYQNIFSSFGSARIGGQRREGKQYFSITMYLDQNSKKIDSLTKETAEIIRPLMEKYRGTLAKEMFVTANDSNGNGRNSDNEVSLYAYADSFDYFSTLEPELEKASKESKLLRLIPLQSESYENIWRFIPRSKSLEEYGLSKSELAEQLASILSEQELTEVRMGAEGFRLYSKLDVEKNNEVTVDQLNRIRVISKQDLSVPLQKMGQWKNIRSLREIKRLDGRTEASFAFASTAPDKTSARKELMQMIEPLQKRYPNVEFSPYPLNSEDGTLKTWAIKAPIYTVCLIFFVLALTLHSLAKTILVWLMIPVGILGVIIALVCHGYELRFMTIIGLLGVAGVAVNGSLILIDAIEKIASDTSSPLGRFQKITQGSSSRLKPLFVTMITTLSGVFPAAYGWGGESGYTQPMVFAMAWGILSANLFAMFMLPLLVAITEDLAVAPKFISSMISRLVSPWREKRHGRVLTSEVRKDPPRTTSQAFDKNLANQG